MADDFFIVPGEVGGLDGETTMPKYADLVDGYTGSYQFFDAATYSDLPWAGEWRYVVRFYADSLSDLDAIANDNGDAYSLNTSSQTEQDVTDYLNDAHDVDRAFSTWQQSYLVG